MDFETELAALLNRHSQENSSSTPDFILARYLVGCLDAWSTATQIRDNWYDPVHPNPSKTFRPADGG